MKTALVTGGGGFIGSHLVRRLSSDGFRTVVVDDLSWGDARKLDGLPNVQFIEADVANVAMYRAAASEATTVFHLAALISAHDSLDSPDAYFRTNVTGLLKLIELCGELPKPRLVLASTSGVYGNSAAKVKREIDPAQPTTVYALTKLAGEHLLEMYRERMGYDDVSLRLFNVYGPGQNPKHPYANVTCKFARAAALGEPVKLYGDGTQTRDFIYVDDVVEAMILASRGPSAHRSYNVGTGSETSIASLLEIAQSLATRRIPVERCPEWRNDIKHIAADTSRFENDLGFRARTGLVDGLRATVAHFAREH